MVDQLPYPAMSGHAAFRALFCLRGLSCGTVTYRESLSTSGGGSRQEALGPSEQNCSGRPLGGGLQWH